MVGLKEFGDAAWACEQIYNTQLAANHAAEPALIDFTNWVLGELAAWVEDIASRRDVGAQRSRLFADAASAGRREAPLAEVVAPAPRGTRAGSGTARGPRSS